MKKYFFLLCFALPITLMAQTKADRVTLKNGVVVKGNIYKIDDGKIYLGRAKDSVMYTVDELKTVAFCNTNDKPCTGQSSQITSTYNTKAGIQNSMSTTASSFSSLDETEDQGIVVEKDDAEKGLVTFKCNMCGNSGTLDIIAENGNGQSNAKYSFTLEKEKHFFVYTAKLLPGAYNWKYSDNGNNASQGKIIIKKKEVKKIVLFEKE